MEKRFTQSQVDLALRKEQLILLIERGESLEAVSKDLGLVYHPKHVSRLRRRYIEGGRHWVALVDGREGGPSTKITATIAQWILEALQGDPGVTASSVRDKVRRIFRVEVSDRRIRQLIHDIGREGQRGRPRQAGPLGETSAEPMIIEQTPHAGIFFPTGCALADADFACDDACVGEVQATVSTARSGE
jgi:transposase